MGTILVTGAKGQIGSDLVASLREQHGKQRVIATDLHAGEGEGGAAEEGPSEALDVRDAARLESLVKRYDVDTIFHLASLLSVVGEQQPDLCWDVNVNGLRNVLAVARAAGAKLFWPSSIAVFGPETPAEDTPQITVLDPTTVYGATKVAGELLCRYAALEYGLDVRSVRFPGLISHKTPPGGGTTDYAVDIFYAAVLEGSYRCFVREDTRLPMMYMPDALRSMVELMAAEPTSITVRSSYNLGGMSFSAGELAAEIGRQLPGFTCTFEPDERQAIADSWPSSVDDSRAREDWGWRHEYELESLVEDMLRHLAPRLEAERELRGTAPLRDALHQTPAR
jgi:nucleoside-diphosphate-sugar epimerase